MPLQSTSGAASYDAFGGGVAAVPKYIEDYFSTFLYSGTGSDQTITNNIDLSTKGGLVWLKKRTYPSGSVTSHYLMDTNRGTSAGYISSNSTAAENAFDIVSSFNTNGFDFNTPVNDSGDTYVSWTWAKAPKFFDVVTYTGNGATSRNISHNLGSDPGCIIVKRTSAANDWSVYHRSTGTGKRLILNDTLAVLTDADMFASVTSTTFSVSGNTDLNDNGNTYVAYLFAHNAGGFGLTGTDNVISCGGVTANGSGDASISLGYEPQWLLTKRTDDVGNWELRDTMRGFGTASGFVTGALLRPNTSGAEASPAGGFYLTSTGFEIGNGMPPNASYIYIAIRRGPMKVPTSGTSVYYGATRSGTSATATVTGVPFPPDLLITGVRTPGASYDQCVNDRLRGVRPFLVTNGTGAEITSFPQLSSYNMDGVTLTNDPGGYGTNQSGSTLVNWFFQRAPSFFDQVCYTGDGTADGRTFTHNLGVTPQLVIVKRRSSTSDWVVMFNTDHAVLLNSTNADTGYSNATGNYANGILVGTNATTLTQYSGASGNSACNASGSTYVAYLFATCAGVSKVGSYTGNGSSQTINCGFTGGARFVLIKKSSGTGDWMVADSARGIVSGNDPYLELNNTNAEVTGEDWLDTDSTGFVVNEVSGSNANTNGATYIFLAIA